LNTPPDFLSNIYLGDVCSHKYRSYVVGIDGQVEGLKWLGLLGEGAYMVGCLPTWIEMVAVVTRSGKTQQCDLVVCNGCTISPMYEHRIHGAPEQHSGFDF
jgi:hypothetical protein